MAERIKTTEDGVEVQLPNGRQALVYPITFGRARIGLVSEGCAWSFDDTW